VSARRLAGAAGIAYVAGVAIENMEILDVPNIGASAAEVRDLYADGALAIVSTLAGAAALVAYAAFALALYSMLRPRAAAGERWPLVGLVGGLGGPAIAAAGLVLSATLAFDLDGLSDDQVTDRFELYLLARMVSGAFVAAFLAGFGIAALRSSAWPRWLARYAVALAPLMLLGPIAAIADSDALESGVRAVFAAQTLWILLLGLWLLLAEGASAAELVRRAAFLLLVIAAGLIGIALVAVPAATGTFFAWVLRPEPLAAFSGGVYVGAAALYALTLARDRVDPRGPLIGAAVLSVSVFVITLTHLDQFDFDRLQAWAWLFLFAGFSAVTVGLFVLERDRAGAAAPIGAGTRTALRLLAVVLGALALALWIDPTGLSGNSPFALPPLGGRFTGSWVALLAILCAWAGATAIRDQAQFAAIALITLPAGALIAALRTFSDLASDSERAIYIAALVALIAAGAGLLARLGNPRRAAGG